MIVPIEIQQWYSDNQGRLEILERTVRATLEHFVSTRGYLFGGRVKTIESVAEKIDTGRFADWDEVDDIYAATIVIPTYAHEAGVREFLRAAFHEVRVRLRGSTPKAPDRFRFDSTRVYCRLSNADPATGLAGLTFEVQIHSAFDYAWGKVTHDLVYKHETVDWRRLRVSAQMKALVEQLDAISEHFDDFVSSVTPSEWASVSARNSIVNHITYLFEIGRLPSELRPAVFSRLAETVEDFLRHDGCRNDELESRVTKALAAVDAYLSATAPRDIPRSVTLAQLLFGVLFRAGVLSARVQQRVLLNEAFLLAFPELKEYGHVFAIGRDPVA